MGERVADPEPTSRGEELEEFYRAWSDKSPELIQHDIEMGAKKASLLLASIPSGVLPDVRTVLDFGCGYGAVLRTFVDGLHAERGLGVDFSEAAIQIAVERFGSDAVRYIPAPSLDAEKIGAFLAEELPAGADCILLVDVLEHVPDCRSLMSALSRTSNTFVIKLPLENSVFDNYVRRKEYPGSRHSNGHLREFTVNDVHYFIRALGLTPLYEDVYVYSMGELFPPPPEPLTLLQRFKRALHMSFRRLSAILLPKRTFLRLVGGGGYFCVATYDSANLLEP